MSTLTHHLVHNYNRAKALLTDPLNTGLALTAARRIFGNTAGFKQNLYGGLELWNAHNHPSAPCADADRELTESLLHNGFAKAPWTYDWALMEQLTARLEDAIEADETNTIRDENGAIIQEVVSNPHASAPEIRDLLVDPLRATLHAYFRSHIRIYFPDFWRNYTITEEQPGERSIISNRWHNDSGKVSVMSIFILLSDVGNDDGPMAIVDRNTTAAAIRHGYRDRDHYGNSETVLEDLTRRRLCTGPAGTAYFLNTRRCMHRASIPHPGHQRDVVSLHFSGIPGERDIWDETKSREERTLEWHRY